MDELIKSLKDFIARDVVYIVGGSITVAAFLYTFDKVPSSSEHWTLFALLAGVGYFVGYCLQDGLRLFHIVANTATGKPTRFVQWLYFRFTGNKWQDINIDLLDEQEKITDERQRARLDRIVNLRHAGTVGGSSFSACFFLLIYRWYKYSEVFDLIVAIIALALGFTLICLGWIKSAEQAQYIATKRLS